MPLVRGSAIAPRLLSLACSFGWFIRAAAKPGATWFQNVATNEAAGSRNVTMNSTTEQVDASPIVCPDPACQARGKIGASNGHDSCEETRTLLLEDVWED